MKLINAPKYEFLLRLSLLTDYVGMINDLAKSNKVMATAYKDYIHYKNKNI